jgi:hypothetical protein
MKSTLVVLGLLISFASATFAQTPSAGNVPALEPNAAVIPEITIGTAVPSGRDFVITLDERSIDLAYPVWTRPLSGAWATIVTKEQFRSVVRDVVRRELAATFPDGFPPDAAASNTELKLELSKPPEINISIGC